jgi:hypothetical protein
MAHRIPELLSKLRILLYVVANKRSDCSARTFWHTGQSDVTEEREFVWIICNTIETKIVFVMLWHDIGISFPIH